MNKHTKRCSTSLIREIQTKTRMRYFTPIRMAITNEAENNKWRQKCGEIGKLVHCLWECKMVQLLQKTLWKFLKILNISVQFSRSVASDSLSPHESQHIVTYDSIAQLVKNLPTMQETLVRFLGQEDPLAKGKATHSSILAWRIPWTAWGRKELDTTM